MGILAILLKNKNLVFIGILLALFAGSGIYIKFLKGDIATITAEKATLVTELQVSVASVKSLQQAILDQNAAIDNMKSAADLRQSAHQAEINKAKATADTYKKQAQDLMDAKAQADKPKCDSANDLMNQEIRNAK